MAGKTRFHPEVSATWPGNSRFNFFSATCADVSESECTLGIGNHGDIAIPLIWHWPLILLFRHRVWDFSWWNNWGRGYLNDDPLRWCEMIPMTSHDRKMTLSFQVTSWTPSTLSAFMRSTSPLGWNPEEHTCVGGWDGMKYFQAYQKKKWVVQNDNIEENWELWKSKVKTCQIMSIQLQTYHYSRRSAAGSARTKVTRCHKRKCRCRSRSNILRHNHPKTLYLAQFLCL